MKTLKVFSIITITIASLAILGSLSEQYFEDFIYPFFGGIFFLVYGILTFNFLDKLKK
jgi:hypothetical protein